jgi:hypothetical protein
MAIDESMDSVSNSSVRTRRAGIAPAVLGAETRAPRRRRLLRPAVAESDGDGIVRIVFSVVGLMVEYGSDVCR